MNTFNIIAGIFTILGFAFGIYQYRKSVKLKDITLSLLQNAAGNICKSQQSTEYAFWNFKNIQKNAIELNDSDYKKEISKLASDGQGDAASADRLLINLFNEFLSLQELQLGERDIKHPEKNELKLWEKELSNRANIKS